VQRCKGARSSNTSPKMTTGANFAQVAGKSLPHTHIQMAYALFGLGAYFVFSHMAGGEFSAILTLSVVFQSFAMALLAVQVVLKRSMAGISVRALQLDAAAICFRLSSTTWLNGYLPVDMTGDWIYQLFDIISLTILSWLLYQAFFRHRHTYQASDDTFAVMPVVLGCVALAALLHADMNARPVFDAFWLAGLLISAVAVLPQLWLINRSHSRCEAFTSHYIAAMAVSRILSGTFMWHARFDITCDPWVQGFNHAVWTILGAHAVHLVLLADFAYYYVKAVLKNGLSDFQLRMDDCPV